MQMSDLFAQFQNSRLFRLKALPEGLSELVLVDFQGTEGLSQLFEFHLRLASQDPNIELKQMIGQPVTISLQLTTAFASSEQRYFHGYVTHFSHLDTDGGLATYSATVRPWLWMLSRQQDIRIFQEQTAQTIISRVFQDYGSLASYEFRLSKATANRSYCTQYRETDLNFVLRLMQEEGLFFNFEHTKTGHKLIVTDSSTSAKPIDGFSPSMPYSQGEMLDDVDVITSLQSKRELMPTDVGLKAVDYKVPNARRYQTSKAEIDQGDVPSYEIYDYVGPQGFPDRDRGYELASFRAKALAAHSKVFLGTSTSRRLMPLRYFQIEDHYDHSGKPEDRQLMILTVAHSGQNNYQAGKGAASYSCSFTCIRKKIPYRPLLTIPRPTIPGPQTAVVVGPTGEEIYTDQLGRVKVQFHWDRLGKKNQSSSCWVRVGQPWAGKGFGMIQIPRIGEEVVVLFLDGNPDRPIIISRVYNAQNMPPWALPASATQSGILTRSSKGATSANANAIRFEDKKGQEEVWLHAEKDQRIEVEHDESHSVGNDRSKTIGHDETVQVVNDRTETVGNNETITIGANRTEQVGENETISIGSHRTVTIGGNKAETIALAKEETIGLAKALTIGGAYQTTVGAAMNTTVALMQAEEVGLSKVVTVGKRYVIDAGDEFTVNVGKASFTLKSDGTILLNGHTLSIGTSGEQTLKADGDIVLKGKNIQGN